MGQDHLARPAWSPADWVFLGCLVSVASGVLACAFVGVVLSAIRRLRAGAEQ